MFLSYDIYFFVLFFLLDLKGQPLALWLISRNPGLASSVLLQCYVSCTVWTGQSTDLFTCLVYHMQLHDSITATSLSLSLSIQINSIPFHSNTALLSWMALNQCCQSMYCITYQTKNRNNILCKDRWILHTLSADWCPVHSVVSPYFVLVQMMTVRLLPPFYLIIFKSKLKKTFAYSLIRFAQNWWSCMQNTMFA